MIRKRLGPALVLLLAGAVVSCGRSTEPLRLSGPTMGTTFSVTVYDSANEPLLDDVRNTIHGILDDINSTASSYQDDSELSRFNANLTTNWQQTSASFCTMVERALAMSRRTNGAFDITVAPLVDLWGFGASDPQDTAPADEDIASTLRLVGHDRIEADCGQPAIRKAHAHMRIDLSGWAKGHAADRIADYLQGQMFRDFMVEIGGELQLSGNRDDDAAFRIALEHPASEDGLTYDVFDMTDTGVATSGDYLNYYEVNGKRYSHAIDPRTGRPVTHALSTVSVMAPSTADADALATALLVMGPERGLEFALEHDIAAYMTEYDASGVRTRATPAFSLIVQ